VSPSAGHRDKGSGAVATGEDLSIVTRKRCARCGVVKPREAFSTNRRNRSGLHSYCKECVREYRERWKEENAAAFDVYNDRRRLPALREARICVECHLPFRAPRRRGYAPSVCSPECRRRRKARIDRERRRRAA
jgi:hypothetical protein